MLEGSVEGNGTSGSSVRVADASGSIRARGNLEQLDSVTGPLLYKGDHFKQLHYNKDFIAD